MTDTQIMGLKMLLIFMLPIAVIYWVRNMLSPTRQIKKS